MTDTVETETELTKQELGGKVLHSVVLITEGGELETIKENMGIADAMYVAAIQSKDKGAYVKVMRKEAIIALYYKGELQ